LINKIKSVITDDLKHTALNQFLRIFYGPITLILMPLFLSSEEQGYWFTMTSIGAMALFADLGFSNILLNFTAHEFAHLGFDEFNNITGNKEHIKRLSTLFIFTIKWGLSLTFLTFPIMLLAGFYLLSKKTTTISWELPWIFYVTASVLTFLNSLILAFIEGCDSVRNIQKIRMKITTSSIIIMAFFLVMGLKLYALAFALVFSSLFGLYLILKYYGHLIKHLILISKTYAYEWKKEFYPLIWRYATTWISGYFMFQLFTPLIFYFQGAKEAGKTGLSMAIWTSLFTVSNAWLVSITPKLGIYIAKKDFTKRDHIFFKNLRLSLISFISGVILLFLSLYILKGNAKIIGRLLGSIPMFLLSLAWLFELVVNGFAVYLRAYKEEPLFKLAFFSAIYTILTTILCAQFLPLDYFFLGFVTLYFWKLPWAFSIFNRQRTRSLVAPAMPTQNV
jgi:hypothetical protein